MSCRKARDESMNYTLCIYFTSVKETTQNKSDLQGVPFSSSLLLSTQQQCEISVTLQLPSPFLIP